MTMIYLIIGATINPLGEFANKRLVCSRADERHAATLCLNWNAENRTQGFLARYYYEGCAVL